MSCTYQTVNLNINLKTGANVLSVEANIKTKCKLLLLYLKESIQRSTRAFYVVYGLTV